MKKFIESSVFTKLIFALVMLLSALVLFWLGTIVGYRQAEYSSRWAGHYAEVFGSMRPPFGMGGGGQEGIGSRNGAVGKVIAVTLPTVAVKNNNEAEKVIILSPATVIRKFRDAATSTDIHNGDFLITVGEPDAQGRIQASFVRIMPPPTR